MKKLALALILALVLSLTLATPVFAGSPPDAAEKGLERAITKDEGNEHTYGSMLQGTIAPVIYGNTPNAWYGPTVAYWVVQNLLGN